MSTANHRFQEPPIRTSIASALPGSTLQGRFRVGRTFDNWCSSSRTNYRVVELLDATGSLRANAWPSVFPFLPTVPEWTIVDVTVTVMQKQEKRFGKLLGISPVLEPSNLDQIETLPDAICHKPGLVQSFRDFAANIATASLQTFVAKVVADLTIMRPYFIVPASRDDHHCDHAGMAEHALQMCSMLGAMAELSQLHRDCAVVLALFHDIGKIRTLADGELGWLAHEVIKHDALTLELLAEPLRWLDCAWPIGALALRHAWTAASPGARFGVPACWVPAVILSRLDAISRSIDLQQRHGSDGLVKLERGRKVLTVTYP